MVFFFSKYSYIFGIGFTFFVMITKTTIIPSQFTWYKNIPFGNNHTMQIKTFSQLFELVAK